MQPFYHANRLLPLITYIMNKFLLSIVLLLAPIYLNAQTNLQGTVKDQQNNPIPYCSIGVKNSRTGSLANEKGQYKLVLPDSVKNNPIIFNALGYLEKTVSLSELQNNGNIVLAEKVSTLNEVTISSTRLKEKTIGQQSRPFLTFSRMFDQNVPTIEQGNSFQLFADTRLNAYNFYIMPSSRYKQITLKLNIYSLKNELPDQSLQNENIIFRTTTTGWQHIDLSPYALRFTDQDKIALTLQLIDYVSLKDTAFVFGLSAKKTISKNLLYRYQSQGNWEASAGTFLSNLQVSYSQKGNKVVENSTTKADTSTDLNTKTLITVYQNRAKAQKTSYGKDKNGKYVSIRDAKIYYEEYGKGDPLILLHGNGGSIADFYQQIPYLSRYFRVIAVDTRAQGRSTDLSTQAYSYEQFASDLFQLTEALQLKRINILGWSDGGNTGLIFTHQHPQLVNKLVTIGANLNPKGVKEDLLAMFRKQISNNDKDTRLIKLMLEEPNISPEQLNHITQKVLIVAGSEDVILEEHTRSIAAMIKNSQLRILPNTTHYLPFEQPEELNRMVLEFLREK